jgi:hypothetical protein
VCIKNHAVPVSAASGDSTFITNHGPACNTSPFCLKLLITFTPLANNDFFTGLPNVPITSKKEKKGFTGESHKPVPLSSPGHNFGSGLRFIVFCSENLLAEHGRAIKEDDE